MTKTQLEQPTRRTGLVLGLVAAVAGLAFLGAKGGRNCVGLGDVDGDGLVTHNDAVMIAQSLVGLVTLTDEQKRRADVNGDGEVTIADSIMIEKLVTGQIDRFPGCNPPAGGTGQHATPGGTLGTITLSQNINKGPTESIKVDYSTTFSTTDSDGTLINWPYRVVVSLVRTQDAVIIGETFFQSGASGFPPGTSKRFTLLTPLAGKLSTGDTLRVDIVVGASPSDASGKPVFGTWPNVATKVSTDRITIGGTAPPSTGCPAPGPRAALPLGINKWFITSGASDPNCGWDVQPVLTLNSTQFRFPTPCGVISILEQMKRAGFTGPLDRLISDWKPHRDFWVALGMPSCPGPKSGAFFFNDPVWWITTSGDFPGEITAEVGNNRFNVRFSNGIQEILGADLRHR